MKRPSSRRLTRSALVLAAGLALVASTAQADPTPAQQSSAAAPAQADDAASPYRVIKENAYVPFVHSGVSGFRVGADKSLILDGPAGRWYRIELQPSCQRDLPWEEHIGLDAATGSLDRFDAVFVDGRRCFIRTIDQIEDPRPVDRALRAAKKAAG